MYKNIIQKYTRYIRFSSFDTSTLEGLAAERYRMVAWSSLANFASTALGMFTLLITVPMTLPYLGEERFGVWMTISSIAAILSFLDFGVGNGLINRVAAVNVNADAKQLSLVITHGLLVLTLIGLIAGLLLIPVFVYLPWEQIIKVKNLLTAAEIRVTLSVFIAIFAVSIPINGMQKIFQGLQLAWQAHLCRGLGSILSMVLVYLVAGQQAGLPVLLLATYGVQTGILFFLVFILIRKNVISLSGIFDYAWGLETRLLVKTGGLFFLLQIGGLFVWGIDSIIISSTLGAASVTKFALVQRLFQFVIVPLAIINSPLWGAFADAHVRGDKAFIKRTLRISLVCTTLIAVVSVVIIAALSSEIFALWLKGASDIPMPIVWSYGILAIFMISANAFAMFLNGVGEIKSQVLTVGMFCVVTLPLKFMLVSRFGIVGLIAATILAYIVTVALPYITIFRKRLLCYLN